MEADHTLANALEGFVRSEGWRWLERTMRAQQAAADDVLRSPTSSTYQREQAAGAWQALEEAIGAPGRMIDTIRGRTL